MKSDFGRRQFLSRTALFGAAAFLLRPAGAAASVDVPAGNDAGARAALAFVQRYSPRAALAANAGSDSVARIDAPVTDVAAMAAALSRAGRHGASPVVAHGNVARFTIAGRAVEVHHAFASV